MVGWLGSLDEQTGLPVGGLCLYGMLTQNKAYSFGPLNLKYRVCLSYFFNFFFRLLLDCCLFHLWETSSISLHLSTLVRFKTACLLLFYLLPCYGANFCCWMMKIMCICILCKLVILNFMYILYLLTFEQALFFHSRFPLFTTNTRIKLMTNFV